MFVLNRNEFSKFLQDSIVVLASLRVRILEFIKNLHNFLDVLLEGAHLLYVVLQCVVDVLLNSCVFLRNGGITLYQALELLLQTFLQNIIVFIRSGLQIAIYNINKLGHLYDAVFLLVLPLAVQTVQHEFLFL